MNKRQLKKREKKIESLLVCNDKSIMRFANAMPLPLKHTLDYIDVTFDLNECISGDLTKNELKCILSGTHVNPETRVELIDNDALDGEYYKIGEMGTAVLCGCSGLYIFHRLMNENDHCNDQMINVEWDDKTKKNSYYSKTRFKILEKD